MIPTSTPTVIPTLTPTVRRTLAQIWSPKSGEQVRSSGILQLGAKFKNPAGSLLRTQAGCFCMGCLRPPEDRITRLGGRSTSGGCEQQSSAALTVGKQATGVGAETVHSRIQLQFRHLLVLCKTFDCQVCTRTHQLSPRLRFPHSYREYMISFPLRVLSRQTGCCSMKVLEVGTDVYLCNNSSGQSSQQQTHEPFVNPNRHYHPYQ